MSRQRRLRRAGALLLAAAGAVATPLAGALELAQRVDALETAEAEMARRVVEDVGARLPAAWRDALPPRVDIDWRDDLPDHVHGRALHDRVLIRRGLLAAPATGDAPHPAAVALVHELAHFFDRSAAGGLSRDARLLDLAGWQRTPFRGRARHSTLTDRTSDPYELANPREFVAVNLERFLFDPEFGCRRPALYRHLAARLQASPRVAPCAPAQPFVQADPRPDAESAPLLEIDPARVVGVDYLLAEPTGAVMSRWGHGMLRLVVCAPHRAPGPDCRLDLEHHRVLSFRAFVDDVQISNWRGLAGSYPSRLFVLPLTQVIDEYTKVELRGLRSVPLRLSPGDIASLLERAAQLHWSYDGRYYFVSNNCAVETWRLLHEGVPHLPGMQRASLTPTGLLRRLQAAGVADTSVFDDAERARRLGHVFDSQRLHYQAMFDALPRVPALPVRDAEAWLDLAPDARAAWIERTDLRAAAAMLVLEGAALRREEQRARDELKRHLLARTPDGESDRAQAVDALRLADRLTRPALFAPQGYGIPQSAERATLADAASAAAQRWREAGAQLQARARAWLSPTRRARLDATEENLSRLGARLRELHRADGGLELAPASR